MILWPEAKRFVSLQVASEIASLVDDYPKDSDGFPKVVGVFVDEDAEQIRSIKDKTHVDIVQLHGDTARDALSSLDSSIPKIYVLHVNAEGEVQGCPETLPSPVDFVLLDGMKGGSGVRFPLETLKLPAWIDDTEMVKHGWLLAGGLSPGNVTQALHELERRSLFPTGLDVSSGVCDESGLRKSAAKIAEFLKRARSVDIDYM